MTVEVMLNHLGSTSRVRAKDCVPDAISVQQYCVQHIVDDCRHAGCFWQFAGASCKADMLYAMLCWQLHHLLLLPY